MAVSWGTIGTAGYSPLRGWNATAPDADAEVICLGARRLTLQISNNAIFITFGHGPGQGAIQYEPTPELYLPVVGSITRPFDAFKIRAQTPLAQLPAGAQQAYAVLVPRQ